MHDGHHPGANLKSFLASNATWPIEMSQEKASQFIHTLNDIEIAELLSTLNEGFVVFLMKNFNTASGSHRRAMKTLLYAFANVKIQWTSEMALSAMGVLATGGGDFVEDAKLIRAIARSEAVVERSSEADQVFEICMSRILDVGHGIEIRKALCRIFGRLYIPTLQTAVQPYANVSFLRFLATLVASLEQLAKERGDPTGGLSGILHRQLAYPLDRQRILELEWAYRAWESAFGEYRWIEVLPPLWRGDRYPALLGHLSGAKGSSPSSKWLNQLDGLVDRFGSEAVRNCLLQQAADFGAGEIVAESEQLWIGKARVYANLYELYSKVPASVDPVRAQLGRTAIHFLPWVGADNIIREYCPPPNPMTVSASNMTMMKGVAWALSRFPDEEATYALHDMVTGSAAPIDTIHGPRTRALAVANAAVLALSKQNNKLSLNTLKHLQTVIEEPRIRSSIVQALKSNE
jgi:hypothetical protein